MSSGNEIIEQQSIKSFVFFDLETTGLPHYENFKTKITELSFVACSKDEILREKGNKLPRVLQKLTFCVNPGKLIQIDATEVSHLDNFMLENEKLFNADIVKMIHSFLINLQQPACLVAHNGNKFDFPILQKEIIQLDEKLLNTLKCVDTIDIFKEIDKCDKEEIRLFQFIVGELEQIEKEEAAESKIKEETQIGNGDFDDQVSANEIGQTEEQKDTKDLWDDSDLEIDWQKINETTPRQQQIIRDVPPGPSNSRKQNLENGNKTDKQKIRGKFRGEHSSKKQLFPGTTDNKMKYRLTNIYERFYGESPDIQHHAEADAINLLKCAMKRKNEFILNAEKYSKLFKDIRPLCKKQ